MPKNFGLLTNAQMSVIFVRAEPGESVSFLHWQSSHLIAKKAGNYLPHCTVANDCLRLFCHVIISQEIWNM
jgi:hypothetical protein